MSELLAVLLSSRRKRIPMREVKTLFFSLYPDVLNSPDRNALLLEELERLHSRNLIVLPAASGRQKAGSPILPAWIGLVRTNADVHVGYSNIAWLPELDFWTEIRASQLAGLEKINDFLLRRRGSLSMVPIKERSLQIFGDEKRLDRMCTGDSLFGGKLPLRALGCFRVPQPLPYRKADAIGKPLLVVENHNTYWSFAEWNESAKCYSAIVYGGGEAFRLTGRALAQTIEEVSASEAEYFGDVDPKGFCIPIEYNRSACAVALKVVAAKSLYAWLVENDVRGPLEGSPRHDLVDVQQWIGGELATRICSLWEAGFRLPQEGLGTDQLACADSAARFSFSAQGPEVPLR